MPGEQLLANAAAGWTGPEAAVLAIIGLAALAGIAGLFIHLRDCKAATERLHKRISDESNERRKADSEITNTLHEVRADVKVLRDRGERK